jgi:esterase/lipase superfamily enzyme
VAAGLRQMADTPVSGGQPHFNEVILAAADIDAQSFRREIAPRIVSVADRVTVYTSDDDQALRASEQVHGATRLGQGGADLVIIPDVPGIDVVDVASLNFEFFDVGHSTHGNELLSDIRQVFSGAATTQRGLQPHPSRQPAWRLPTSDVQLVSHTEPVDEEQKEEVEEAEESIAPTSNSLWGRVRTWWPW